MQYTKLYTVYSTKVENKFNSNLTKIDPSTPNFLNNNKTLRYYIRQQLKMFMTLERQMNMWCCLFFKDSVALLFIFIIGGLIKKNSITE